MAAGSTSRRSRRERAPKPLSVPMVAALGGVALFFLGIVVASVDVSALGALLFFWGLCSFSVLVLLRRRRATREAQRRHREAPPAGA